MGEFSVEEMELSGRPVPWLVGRDGSGPNGTTGRIRPVEEMKPSMAGTLYLRILFAYCSHTVRIAFLSCVIERLTKE